MADDFKYAGYCHCSQCRKFSGAAASAFAGIVMTSFRLLRGAGSLATYAKSADSELCFCKMCGSSLFSRKPHSGMMHIRLGSLDDAPSIRPQAHLFVGSKAPWHDIGNDGLPRLEAMPPAPPARMPD